MGENSVIFFPPPLCLASRYIVQDVVFFCLKKKNVLAKGDSKLLFGKPVDYLEMLTAKKSSTVIKCVLN